MRQEERVWSYIEEFRELQTIARGWSEKFLIGTFVNGFKPRLTKELKL